MASPGNTNGTFRPTRLSGTMRLTLLFVLAALALTSTATYAQGGDPGPVNDLDALTLSIGEDVASVSKVSPAGVEPAPMVAASPLPSRDEAVIIADEFLRKQLGPTFMASHLKIKGVEEQEFSPSLWFILYEYTDRGYTADLTMAIDHTDSPSDPSRVVWDVSRMLASPQEVLLSEEDAERIASEAGLAGPHLADLRFHWEDRRLVWMVWNPEIRGPEEVAGYVVDAESGEIVQEVSAGTIVEWPQSRSTQGSESIPVSLARSTLYGAVFGVVVIGSWVRVRIDQRRRRR